MKLNRLGFSFLFLVSAPAFATPELFTQTFDLSGVHYTLNFTADDTSQTVITALADSFAGTDPLTLLAPNSISSNDNLFDPTATDPALGGGWSLSGIGLHDIVTNLDYDLFNIFDTSKEHRKCDDPRVAGGPDVLSKSAAPSQAETKHKGTEPA
jgi:hypothetical protein